MDDDLLAFVRNGMRCGHLGEVERPYDPPKGERVVARVEMARQASYWRADTEALLIENNLSAELAPTVEGLVDSFGMSIRSAVQRLRVLFDAYPPE